MKPSKPTIKSVDGSPDTVYVQLDKVKELIEVHDTNLPIPPSHIVKVLLEQLENLT